MTIVAGTAFADTEFGHTGRVDAHRLRDIFGYPGARCLYTGSQGSETLTSLVIRSPVVHARNATSGRDYQAVGWRARLQKLQSGSWTNVAVTDVERELATDLFPAEFSRKSIAVSSPGRYRTLVVMYWYSPEATTVVGRAVHRVDHYAILFNGEQASEADHSCTG